MKNKNTDEVILTGVSTDICVQNTAAGARYRGFDITVLKDCSAAISEEKHSDALKYMKEIYGAEIMAFEDIIETWEK